MTFDNSKRLINIRIWLFAVTVVVLAYLVMAYVSKTISFPFLGLSDTYWTVILAGLWVIIAMMPMYLNYQYVYFSDEGEKLVFRHFNAGIVGGRKNSIEIDKRTYAGYSTEKRFFGLITSITLFQKFADGVAKYPPVYISALSKEEKEKLFRVLGSYYHA